MDLHRHDEYSSFDGFGKSKELALIAKSLGHTALGISNHGNTNGLVQHYIGCREVGIKPVLGVEGYFLPKYTPQNRGYHLCLFAKNHQGYRNINEIQYEGEKQKYYNPIWDFEILRRLRDGVICTSACVASYSSQCIKNGKLEKAKKYLAKMKRIFGEDFYIEIQPYEISEKGLQEKINVELIKLAKELGIKCILTSDSHRGRKDELSTYLKMHEVAGHDLKHIEDTYRERYMPSDSELLERFCKMHERDFGKETKRLGRWMVRNLREIEDKVDPDILEGLQQTLPKFSDDSYKVLVGKVKNFLKENGKYNKKYIERVKQELKVIKKLGFEDYFLIVADYVHWAKKNGIQVGPGRGSACNCEVAYCLGITEVDSLFFNLDFRRFLREDKKKMPDIDIDFETSRRQEVIQYVVNKYAGQTARIASYGLYKVDNLVNDLAKVCGLQTSKDVDPEVKRKNEDVIADIKRFVTGYIDENGDLDCFSLLDDPKTKSLDRKYDGIITHFSKLYKKVRFIGTHAAGVAVTGGNILDYTSIRIDKSGDIYTNYDLNDMENIHVIKFDMLGLQTMEEVRELKDKTGDSPDYRSIVTDKKVMEAFESGDTAGIFQFDKKTVRNILEQINCNCFDDVVAANAMNRPGPLSLGMPEQYSKNKRDIERSKKSLYYEYTKESYGTVIYQEQIQQICVNIGNMSWGDADKVMKMIGGQSQSEDARMEFERNKKELHDKFVEGAVKNGFKRSDAEKMFNVMLVYSFNKGHAVGYSLISVLMMYYKIYYPEYFWYVKLKYAMKQDLDKFKNYAVHSGAIILLPHVNGTAQYSLSDRFGSACLQEGLCNVDFVGLKAAELIEEERLKNGEYKSFSDFRNRLPGRVVTARVLNSLENAGALEFNQKKYLARVEKYNAAMFGRGM